MRVLPYPVRTDGLIVAYYNIMSMDIFGPIRKSNSSVPTSAAILLFLTKSGK
jgi:hypothetical protein